MKLIDKLKNVFFEEVEDDEDEEEIPQTFARKVEVPKKNVEPPKKEVETVPVVEKSKEEEKIKIEEPVEPTIFEEKKEEKEFPMMFDDDDFLEDKEVSEKIYDKPVNSYKRESMSFDDEKELYKGKKEVSYAEKVNNKPSYSYSKSFYEEKETKVFKPSPIISPIYGILDKNYHKEEIVTKRETRITSTYSKPDVDSIRNKAFGGEEEVKKPVKEEKVFETNKVYDVNNNKPQVSKVTLADADEYYNDLGLAYNVDYSDASRTTRTEKYNGKDKKRNKSNVDDNLFDLIDSMYNKED